MGAATPWQTSSHESSAAGNFSKPRTRCDYGNGPRATAHSSPTKSGGRLFKRPLSHDQRQVFSSTCQPPGVVTMMSSLVSWLRSPVRK